MDRGNMDRGNGNSQNNDSATPQPEGKVGPVKSRHERIEQLVKWKGFVTIESLAHEFSVTPQTIRRDINTLTKDGVISRYHGGAGLAPTILFHGLQIQRAFQPLLPIRL